MRQQNCVDKDPSAKIQQNTSYPNAHPCKNFQKPIYWVLLPTGKQTNNVKKQCPRWESEKGPQFSA